MKFNVRINIRQQTAKVPQKLHLICRWDGLKLVYPTRHNVLPKYWSNKAQSIRNTIEEPNRDKINKHINEIQIEAKRIFDSKNDINKNLSKSYLKQQLDIWNGYENKEILTFSAWLQKYIDDSPERLNPRTGRKISFRTIQEYKTTQTYLKEFEKANNETLDFDNITVSTLQGFNYFLTTVKGFALNNIAKHIDNLRQFLRAAQDDKIQIDIDTLNTKKFKVARENAQNVYLNNEEINALFKLDLSENATFDRVRDLFLIGCLTGLRISDYNNLKPHHIKGDLLHITTEKTKQQVVIPITDKLRIILSKYNGSAPPKISDQKLNKYIKEICSMAEINEETEKQQTKNGKIETTIQKKWELITSHTARRSFATNGVKQNIPINLLMAITGHTSEKMFWKYVKLSPLEKGLELQKYTNQFNNL